MHIDLTHQGRVLGHHHIATFDPGGPSVHRKCAHSAHVHENGFSRPPGDFTYTPPFSRPYRGFHDFHVFSRTFMVFARPFAHIFTYVLWFSRPSPVFTPTPCFHVHTVIFEFIWPNGLWTHFSCPNGPPGCSDSMLLFPACAPATQSRDGKQRRSRGLLDMVSRSDSVGFESQLSQGCG